MDASTETNAGEPKSGTPSIEALLETNVTGKGVNPFADAAVSSSSIASTAKQAARIQDETSSVEPMQVRLIDRTKEDGENPFSLI